MGKRMGRANIPTLWGLSAPETPRAWEAAGQPPPELIRDRSKAPFPLQGGKTFPGQPPPTSAREDVAPLHNSEDAKESLWPLK